jgi:hypothetical protein
MGESTVRGKAKAAMVFFSRVAGEHGGNHQEQAHGSHGWGIPFRLPPRLPSSAARAGS